VWREHTITCFVDDPVGIKNRHAIGVDTITWECDYPHSDTTWPSSPEILARSLTGVPDDEVAKITHENALRFFRAEPFSRRPREKCTAAALRAESPGVDVAPKKIAGGKPPTYDLGRPVTSKDILDQLASVYAVNPE
jgi:hypothetical protein